MLQPTPPPFSIAPVDLKQDRLTRRHLKPVLRQLEAWLLDRRAEIDRQLGASLGPARVGKPYPYGRCQEISTAMAPLLQAALSAPRTPPERALHRFVAEGGRIQKVWGVLRDRYFQNAYQFGAWYVDVSNDTVDVNKPKVEILPMGESGLENVRDLAHFATIAERYWQVRLYANLAVPSLAPLLPILATSDNCPPELQPASDYMIALMIGDGLRQARAWLETAPPPSPDLLATLQPRIPEELRCGPGDARALALAACDAACAQGVFRDPAWRDARVLDYLRIMRGFAVNGCQP